MKTTRSKLERHVAVFLQGPCDGLERQLDGTALGTLERTGHLLAMMDTDNAPPMSHWHQYVLERRAVTGLPSGARALWYILRDRGRAEVAG